MIKLISEEVYNVGDNKGNLPEDKVTISEETLAIQKRVEIGELLQNKRADKGLSLRKAGKSLGVSANYISELERGLKVPSDYFTRKLSEFYGISETKLFESFGKIPLTSREELAENKRLQKILHEIRTSRTHEDKKQGLYDKLHDLYRELIEKEEDKE